MNEQPMPVTTISEETSLKTPAPVARSRPRHVLLLLALPCALLLLLPAPALASGPLLRVDSLADSTVAPGTEFKDYVDVSNLGDAETTGETDLRIDLPQGITAVSLLARNRHTAGFLECTAGDGSSPVSGASAILCKDPDPIGTMFEGGPNNARDVLTLTLQVDSGVATPSTLTTSFVVSNSGGAAGASTADPTTITNVPPSFGIDAFDGLSTADAAGDPYSQAAGTPYQATTEIDFNTQSMAQESHPDAQPVEPTKDVGVDLPAGFVGIPGGVPQCTSAELANANSPASTPDPVCPAASQVGVAFARTLTLGSAGFAFFPVATGPLPVYNMVPPPGVPARLAYKVFTTIVTLDAGVRSGSDYGVSVVSRGVSEGLPVAGADITLWGVPADPSHDPERSCPGAQIISAGSMEATDPSCVDSHGDPAYTRPALTSFLRNPTSCTGPLTTSAHVDSWFKPGAFTATGAPELSDPNWISASFASHNPPGFPLTPSDWGSSQGITGCAQVPFDPEVTVEPTSHQAASPTGLNVTLSIPQTLDAGAIGEADLKKVVVTLPAGMTDNASAASGLGACTQAQIALHSDGPASCPINAKIGTVEIDTPLLADPLHGSVYLAKQTDNPFGTLLALYIVVSEKGVNVKLAGKVEADQTTGQLTATFDNNPQLPFTTLHLSLFGGDRAPLANSPTCGTETTQAQLSSWALPDSVVPLSESFDVTSGANGTPCASSVAQLPFTPSFTAGTTTPTAGSYSPLSVSISRSDQDQTLGSIAVRNPQGLSGKLAGIPLCPEPQAAQGTCPAASQIGHVTVAAGAGPSPVAIPEAGKPQDPVFLTGPYKGAPFGLSVVVPAEAGPFNLGTVITRAAINVDPSTAQIGITSDPLPTILQGIPLDVRTVNVIVDRPGFTFNPTSCNPTTVDGTITSTQGAQAQVSSRFQAANCSNLKFKPKFTASTQGNGRINKYGASLDVKIRTGQGPDAKAGEREANIKKVEVALPRALASRLETLQLSCTEGQFAKDPAGCPAESNVGTATAATPLLDNPLSGPAYLVSHGNEAFPDLVILLQGEGIHLEVLGHTQIKNGITYSHFETVPDAPISSFELKLPEGRYSVLGATANLCGRTVRRPHRKPRHVATSLSMPTTITAQNGAVLKQTTKIGVTGCAKAKSSAHRRR